MCRWLKKFRKGRDNMERIRWLGHAGFEIELTNKVVLIDPWLEGNPRAPMKAAGKGRKRCRCDQHRWNCGCEGNKDIDVPRFPFLHLRSTHRLHYKGRG